MAVFNYNVVISKANSIRFAYQNGQLRSFDNMLSYEEEWSSAIGDIYKQTFLKDDVVLLQLRAGNSATCEVYKVYADGTETLQTETANTPYTDFTTRDYLLTFSAVEEFQIKVISKNGSTTVDTWLSECIEVVEDEDLLLIQWSNLDQINDTFEFDYSTTQAQNNVNFMRLNGQLLEYAPGGESTIYDNQNEKTKIKGNYFRMLTLQTDKIPRQIAEILTIAMQHDLFLVNEQGFIAEESPEINMMGGFASVSAKLTLGSSLGINAYDIGYDCDATTDSKVENLKLSGVTGAHTLTGSGGYAINQIILDLASGADATIKIGTTVGGDEILKSYQITTAKSFVVLARNTIPEAGLAGDWSIYVEVSGGGTADIYIQLIESTQ